MVLSAKSRQDVITRVERIRPELRANGVRRLALFGSIARDSATPESDVDFLVEFLPGEKTFDRFLAVCELLETTLNRRVDLLTPESLSPYIGPQILQEANDVIVAD